MADRVATLERKVETLETDLAELRGEVRGRPRNGASKLTLIISGLGSLGLLVTPIVVAILTSR